MAKHMSFHAKLAATCGALLLLAMSTLLAASLHLGGETLARRNSAALLALRDGVTAALAERQRALLAELRAEASLLASDIASRGQLRAHPWTKHSLTGVNQLSGISTQVEIPALFAGQTRLDSGGFLGRPKDTEDIRRSVLQLLPDMLVRISTTLEDDSGRRSVGSYIPADSPVYKIVARGKPHLGRAFSPDGWRLAAVLPLIDPDGRVLGAVSASRPLLSLELKQLLAHGATALDAQTIAANSFAEIVLHPDPGMIGRHVSEVVPVLATPTIPEGIVEFDTNGRALVAAAGFVESLDLRLAFVLPADAGFGALRSGLLTAATVLGAIVLALAALAMTLSLRRSTRPLEELARYTSDIAAGKYDSDIQEANGDTVGRTISSVKRMVEELKAKLGYSQGILHGISLPCVVVDTDNLVTYINQHIMDFLEKDGTPTDYLGLNSGEFLFRDPSKLTKSLDALQKQEMVQGEMRFTTDKGKVIFADVTSTPFYDLDGRLMGTLTLFFDLTTIRSQEAVIRDQNEKIARIAGEASQIAELVSSASEELSAQIEQASSGAAQQNERTSETATAMDEMNATVLEVARNATEAAKDAAKARDMAKEGENSVRDVIGAITQVDSQARVLEETMTALSEQAKGIGQVIEFIEDIADQTNLLALNAAIEAARAGHAGRGFAVVADEVKKLAQKTMTATQKVALVIESIQQGTLKSFEAMKQATEAVSRSTSLAEDSGRSLAEIVQIVDGTAMQVHSIATASEEQSSASEHINQAIEDISRISSETAEGMDQSARAVTDLAMQAMELRRLIEEMQDGETPS